MGNFGEDLRKERLSRGIALEEITAVTKISQRHLVALEQERFRLLPGGILSKGIVRGYAGAVGLDQQDWTKRFLDAYVASGQMIDDDRSWLAFASNVGKARILRHDAIEVRLRWAGAILLLLVVTACSLPHPALLRPSCRVVVHSSAHGSSPSRGSLLFIQSPRHSPSRPLLVQSLIQNSWGSLILARERLRFTCIIAPLSARWAPFAVNLCPHQPAAITIYECIFWAEACRCGCVEPMVASD